MDIAGMVRRIDELGRVVIPKEIRRTLRIKEGEEMTVSLMDEDTVVMRKFSPLKAYTEKARDYRAIIEKSVDRQVIVSDKDSVISAKDKSLIGKKLSTTVERAICERKKMDITASLTDDTASHDYLVLPIVLHGDTLGGIIVEADTPIDKRSTSYLSAIAELIALNIE